MCQILVRNMYIYTQVKIGVSPERFTTPRIPFNVWFLFFFLFFLLSFALFDRSKRKGRKEGKGKPVSPLRIGANETQISRNIHRAVESAASLLGVFTKALWKQETNVVSSLSPSLLHL